jgi:tetratricopeptide (TPR) repeat protein
MRRHRALTATFLVVVVAAFIIASLLRIHEQRQLVSYLDVARESTERQAWDHAETAFRAALDLDSSHGETYIDYARMKFSQFKTTRGQEREPILQTALELCRAGLELMPDDVLGLNIYGAILREQSKMADAIEAFRNACRLDDTRWFTWGNLGAVQAVDGDFSAARRSLNKAVELAEQVTDPDHLRYTADVWRNMASLQLFAGDREAEQNIERALRLDRHDFASLALRAKLRIRAGDWQNARDDATQALRESQGRFAPAARLQALAYLGQGDLERASQSANAAVELGDVPAINHLIIASAEARLGRVDVARRHLSEAEALWPPQLESSICRCLATGENNLLWIDSARDFGALRDSARKLLETRPES